MTLLKFIKDTKMQKLFLLISLFVSLKIHAGPVLDPDFIGFDKIILSKDLKVECAAKKGFERGAFGLDYNEAKIKHVFLVLTGVYYDTCWELYRKIVKLKKHNPKIRLIGTEGQNVDSPNEKVWRFRSVSAPNGEPCISYFESDCK